MVRHGVGVVGLVVALAGCGSSDEDKVAALAKQLRSAAERHDGEKLGALEPPADLDRVYRDTLSTLAGLAAALHAESAAVARDDRAGAQRAVARLGPLDFRKGVGFNRLGLANCMRL
jgi:hypothetical protein